jgi:hypothetical protein
MENCRSSSSELLYCCNSQGSRSLLGLAMMSGRQGQGSVGSENFGAVRASQGAHATSNFDNLDEASSKHDSKR